MKIDLLYDAHAVLGEGPFWHPREERLYWLDIEGKLLHRFDPQSAIDETFILDGLVGCIAPVSEEPGETTTLLIAAENGVRKISIRGISVPFHKSKNPSPILHDELLVHPEKDRIDIRYNDGKCSPEGRFWFGSISKTRTKDTASLFVLDRSGDRRIHAATNSNGLGWSPDGKTFYWIDTPTLTVFAFDYEGEKGTIANRRAAVVFPTTPGFGRPDGMTVDAEGMLWIAHWMGAAISRWNPVTGEILARYSVSVQRVTSLAFGGKNGDKLFITTASNGATEEELAAEPHAGGVFVAEPNVVGTKTNFFRPR